MKSPKQQLNTHIHPLARVHAEHRNSSRSLTRAARFISTPNQFNCEDAWYMATGYQSPLEIVCVGFGKSLHRAHTNPNQLEDR